MIFCLMIQNVAVVLALSSPPPIESKVSPIRNRTKHVGPHHSLIF